MLENGMIRHCAATLAGIKTANMFSYKFSDADSLEQELQQVNEKLNEKGVFVTVLKIQDTKALIYVYRRSRLESDLSQQEVKNILSDCGYEKAEMEECIEQLKKRLAGYDCFPHEVGLFLGYPIPDVKGFIEQKGKNYKYSGIWKVYGDEFETRKVFRKLEKCAQVYIRLFAGGRSITKLTVAA